MADENITQKCRVCFSKATKAQIGMWPTEKFRWQCKIWLVASECLYAHGKVHAGRMGFWWTGCNPAAFLYKQLWQWHQSEACHMNASHSNTSTSSRSRARLVRPRFHFLPAWQKTSNVKKFLGKLYKVIALMQDVRETNKSALPGPAPTHPRQLATYDVNITFCCECTPLADVLWLQGKRLTIQSRTHVITRLPGHSLHGLHLT